MDAAEGLATTWTVWPVASERTPETAAVWPVPTTGTREVAVTAFWPSTVSDSASVPLATVEVQVTLAVKK